MLADVQAGCVEHLDGLRGTPLDGAGEMQLLEPGAVKPYGGELQRPNKVKKYAPVCFVEFDNAALEGVNAAASRLHGTETVHVLCCAINAAGGSETASEGVRLLSWAALALRGLEVHLPGGGLATVERMGVQRLLSGDKLWAAALTPELTIS
jgi:hypothetical protein